MSSDSEEALIDALAAARPAQTDAVGLALLAAVRGALTASGDDGRASALLGAYEVDVAGESVLVVPKHGMFAYVFGLIIAATAPAQAGASKAAQAGAGSVDAQTRAAIEAVAYDYVDGQLEGDAQRVARALHPDLAKRAVSGPGPTSREVFPLRRMTADELIVLTHQGELKTPREQWDRSVKVLDVYGTAAVVRVETPWFVDYFHMGRFGERWLIVNALWYSKPQPPR